MYLANVLSGFRQTDLPIFCRVGGTGQSELMGKIGRQLPESFYWRINFYHPDMDIGIDTNIEVIVV